MQIATLAIALIGCMAKMVQLERLDGNIWACSRGTVMPCSFIMSVLPLSHLYGYLPVADRPSLTEDCIGHAVLLFLKAEGLRSR